MRQTKLKSPRTKILETSLIDQQNIDEQEVGLSDGALLDDHQSGSEFDNHVLRKHIKEALNDPRPGIAASDVFEKIERKHAERMKALGRAS